ncbi:MAG TPA: class I SAM-dependent methyltransferase [Thermoanaerobaculia bacterium]|nr:class I SAM-dependent methyltransferase [Thermoanaerobaculia bacterium]
MTSFAPEGEAESRLAQRLRWEAAAQGFSDLWNAPTTQYYRRMEVALIRRAFGPLEGKRVLKLDLWNEAFNTRILEWVAEEGAEVVAFDASQVVTARARRQAGLRGRNLMVACADIREFPFADRSFDCVYTMGTIEHIPEYVESLREVHRVLRDGGRAVIGVPHKWDPFLRPLLVRVLELVGRYPYTPEKSFGARELQRDIESAGLEVLERTGILALPGILRMLDLFFLKHGVPLARLTSAMSAPFEYCESRFPVAARAGYLMAMVARRPREGATA